ncbi:ubiquinol--cytochrome-c reductase catalytic subunit rip1 [Zygosaccharomyces mellis]|uniref:Cytochrome b-c1 complex subunit Rieske, mitochondrial n=1 Tax=Zygosaccharomyces mellis TaxID=42258 RepID=A0A4C2E8P3_9SACH|nr:ubiquinol--cytochrome-c reductase catalytic subunit rip1 [Zygosaccharomyces mellis]
MLSLRSSLKTSLKCLAPSTRMLSSSSVAAKSTYRTPNFGDSLRENNDPDKSRSYAYFMVGSLGLLSSAGAKSTVDSFVSSMCASADVLAMAKVEVSLAAIPEGKNVVVKWQGKPVFIRHRTAAEVQEANEVQMSALKDPQTDADRTKDPQWLIMLGICTHLGCVPIGESGDFGGWFCPCHGSHYDISGRIRKGPAPLNLEIPTYEFEEDGQKLIVG